MIRKTLTILCLLGLLLSVGLWAVSYFNVACYSLKGNFALTSGRIWWSPGEPSRVLQAVHRRVMMVGFTSSVDPVLPMRGSKPNVTELRITISCGEEGEPREFWSEHAYVVSGEYKWDCIGYFDLRTRWTPWVSRGPVVIPLWMPSLLFGLLFSFSCLVPIHRRRRRRRLGLCLKCGYDLRASKERCPECGNEFETT